MGHNVKKIHLVLNPPTQNLRKITTILLHRFFLFTQHEEKNKNKKRLPSFFLVFPTSKLFVPWGFQAKSVWYFLLPITRWLFTFMASLWGSKKVYVIALISSSRNMHQIILRYMVATTRNDPSSENRIIRSGRIWHKVNF